MTVPYLLHRVYRVSQDIAQYNDPANLEDAKEESGWKLVHGDVFRPPATYPMLFRWVIQYCALIVAVPQGKATTVFITSMT